MTKKKNIIILCLTAFVFILLVVFAVRIMGFGDDLNQDLQYTYTKSLGQFTEYIAQSVIALDKSQYCTTVAGHLSVAMQIMQAGTGAKVAMSYLPFSDNNSTSIESHISVASDFALYITEKTGRGEELSEDDRANYNILYEGMSQILDEFVEIRAQVESGNLSIGQTGSILSKSLNLPTPPVFDENLSDFTEQITEMASIIYNGPFSNHVENQESYFLKGKAEISESEALSKASKFLEEDVNSLQVISISEGNIPSFEIASKDGVIRITKVGGEVLYYKKSHETSQSTMSYEKALEQAKVILQKNGYTDVVETYYVINDNTCTINFASVYENVTMYPDLIKVTVELNEGKMVEFSANGYIMNHKDRTDTLPMLSEAQAAESISELLDIQKIYVAVISTGGGEEALCYEFLCLNENSEEVLVYINGENGLEEDIFLINRTEQGVLVK